MRANLKRRKLLFKAKTQSANNSRDMDKMNGTSWR
jgi:hypothetical protein